MPRKRRVERRLDAYQRRTAEMPCTDRKDRPRILAKLTAAGHSPRKALEVALDAERGDAHAMAWIEIVERGDTIPAWAQ